MEEYEPSEGPASKIPAVAGQVLMKGNDDGAVIAAKAKLYRLATATCMYMIRGRA